MNREDLIKELIDGIREALPDEDANLDADGLDDAQLACIKVINEATETIDASDEDDEEADRAPSRR